MLADFEHLKDLPTDVKRQLIDELQLSIEEDSDDTPPVFDESTLREAHQRIADMKSNPELGISLEEMWKRLDAARG